MKRVNKMLYKILLVSWILLVVVNKIAYADVIVPGLSGERDENSNIKKIELTPVHPFYYVGIIIIIFIVIGISIVILRAIYKKNNLKNDDNNEEDKNNEY